MGDGISKGGDHVVDTGIAPAEAATESSRKKMPMGKSQALILPQMKEKLAAMTKFLRLFDELPDEVKPSFLDELYKALPTLRDSLNDEAGSEPASLAERIDSADLDIGGK